ncbi:MAG TPA: SGNH/GDSL hydrolase family protein [Candidatus Limnocylindria bacterium]|nr:SGNH/GDSL hydrolase family protein [Candidatus Limnocylindria bacterium]
MQSASPGVQTLHMVGLGDSYLSAQNAKGQTFLDIYATALESSAGRPVEVTLIASGDMTTAKLKESLATDESVRDSVANADIVVISVGGNDSDPFGIYPDGTCAPTQPPPECLEAYSPTLAGNYEEILDSITALRDGQPTALRVTSMDDPFVGWSEAPSDTFARDFFAQVAEAQTEAVFALAQSHGAKTVDYLHAFNGADGLSDPAQYLAADHSHPGELGIQAIADLLIEVGIAELGVY